MVLFFTSAYNAESTLQRAIDSVKAQTYGEWMWQLVDNGSSDNTGVIIQHAAATDGRIVAYTNKKNHVWESGNSWWDTVQKYYDSDFLCFLDADDEYIPDFLEKMLEFTMKKNLEIGICGSEFIDASNGKTLVFRRLDQCLIFDSPDDFSTLFPQYHQFMRTTWGKLYKLNVVKQFDWKRVPPLRYGWDTLFTQEMFRNASRVGILTEALHRYYISPKSASYLFDNTRIESDRQLFKASREFLIEKNGCLSPKNEEFIFHVYMNAIIETLNVHLNSDAPDVEKLVTVLNVFNHEYTKQLASFEKIGFFNNGSLFVNQRRNLFATTAKWLINHMDSQGDNTERLCDVGEFICETAEAPEDWIWFEKLRCRYLIEMDREDEAKPRIEELHELLPNDEEMKNFINYCQMLH